MNYLAHIFLSGNDPRMQFGNFIGDAVKGSSYNDYPQPISDGILLHRAIDAYTDNHPAVKRAVRSMKPHFGRYSGILLDIYFDYLLASGFSEFSEIPLKKYNRRFYFAVIGNYRYLPKRIRRFIWHFIGTDRLGKYATTDGIRRSLEIMTSVHSLDISVDEAVRYLALNSGKLREIFIPFFTDLRAFCNGYISADDRRAYLKSTG